MISNKIRKFLPLAGGAAFLAAPACAAVCPKGIGLCPYPGKCFMYVDADGDSICDYTSGSSTSAPTEADPVTVSDSTSDTSQLRHRGDTADSTSSAASVTAGTGSSDDSGINLLLYTAAGLLIAGAAILILYFAMRYLKRKNPEAYSKVFLYAGFVPVLLAVLIILNEPESFGFSGTLADLTAAYTGIVYMFGGTLAMAWLWMKNALSKKALLSVLVLTSAAGFLIVLPIAPDGFYSVISGVSLLNLAALGFIGLVALILISFLFGRVFCAHMCPAGALQELLSRIPVNKLKVRDRRIPKAVRAIVFAIILGGVIFSYDIFEYIGVSHLFALMFTAAAGVFLVFLLLSIFVYRPFCTFVCPYGLVFSLFAHFGRFRLKRTASCINCKKCEKICPTGEAGRDDKKSECYLCGRCIEVCPVESAIVYGKRG